VAGEGGYRPVQSRDGGHYSELRPKTITPAPDITLRRILFCLLCPQSVRGIRSASRPAPPLPRRAYRLYGKPRHHRRRFAVARNPHRRDLRGRSHTAAPITVYNGPSLVICPRFPLVFHLQAFAYRCERLAAR
jgi:hypothetical protein